MKKNILSAIAALFLTSLAHAQASPQITDLGNSGGGGHIAEHQLYDSYLETGVKQIDITTLDAYKIVVVPVLARVNEYVPGFLHELKGAIKGKQWLLDSRPLNCPLKGMVKVDAWPAACQDNFVVRVSTRLFPSKKNKGESVEVQGEVLLHELVRAVAWNDKLGDDSIEYATPMLLHARSENEMQSELIHYGFGSYLSGTTVRKYQSQVDSLAQIDKDANNCARPLAQRQELGTSGSELALRYMQDAQNAADAADNEAFTETLGYVYKIEDYFKDLSLISDNGPRAAAACPGE